MALPFTRWSLALRGDSTLGHRPRAARRPQRRPPPRRGGRRRSQPHLRPGRQAGAALGRRRRQPGRAGRPGRRRHAERLRDAAALPGRQPGRRHPRAGQPRPHEVRVRPRRRRTATPASCIRAAREVDGAPAARRRRRRRPRRTSPPSSTRRARPASPRASSSATGRWSGRSPGPARCRRWSPVASRPCSPCPVAHIMGFAALLGLACAGIPVYFLPRFNPVKVLDAIEERRASVFIGVPGDVPDAARGRRRGPRPHERPRVGRRAPTPCRRSWPASSRRWARR